MVERKADPAPAKMAATASSFAQKAGHAPSASRGRRDSGADGSPSVLP
jgi:hypothetical protein